MKLSVITINYNGREGLQRTINSVLAQTFTDYEWIVIDGGSTDGSKELIEQYAAHFSYWVSEPDGGVYQAMNKGIRHASGEYLQFLNGGDWLYSPTTLADVFNTHHDADVLYGDSNIIEPVKDAWIKREPDKLILGHFYSASIGHQSAFVKRTCFEKIGLYDESFKIIADWKFFLTALLNNMSFAHLPITVANFDLTGMSATQPEQTNIEKEIIRNTLIPEYFRDDLSRLESYTHREYLLTHRRSTQWIIKLTATIVLWIDKELSVIERNRYKRKASKIGRN